MARFIERTIPAATEDDLWLCVLVSHALAGGNVCLRVDQLQPIIAELGVDDLIDGETLRRRIARSPVIGVGDDTKPLICERDRLYLHRYCHYERSIAGHLLSMVESTADSLPDERAQQAVEAMFPDAEPDDMQKLAAIITLRHALAIISGGPGTGKTWAVNRILQLLRQRNPTWRIRLAAPTGKAAARLNSSIDLAQLNDSGGHAVTPAVTLHRLLRIHRHSHRPRFHAHHPLSCDVLVVDEASMIDQRMMALLCAALPASCRLILLGDKDQLSSVEAGSVFADLCGGLPETRFSTAQREWLSGDWGMTTEGYRGDHRLHDRIVVLQQSRRFAAESALGQLAAAVNRGDYRSCHRILAQSSEPVLRWVSDPDETRSGRIVARAVQHYSALVQAVSIDEAFGLFQRFRVLSPVWQGQTGVTDLNARIELAVKARTRIDPDADYFAGKPLMMTSNLYPYDIYNGDIAILWPDDRGRLCAWFETDEGAYRCLSLAQLPGHQSAYVMTVHKSQGSEFGHVLVVLPEIDSPILTRELFYTAVTRSSSSLEIWANEDIIQHTVERRTQRVSGLLDRLTSP